MRAHRGNCFSNFIAQGIVVGRGEREGKDCLLCLYPASLGQYTEALRVRAPETLEPTRRREPCLPRGC